MDEQMDRQVDRQIGTCNNREQTEAKNGDLGIG